MNLDERGPDISKLSTAKKQLLKKLLAAPAAKQNAAPVVQVSQSGPCRLSFAQQRLWFLQQLNPSSPFYTILRAYRLAGPLNESVLKKSLQALIRRHEGLRTTFQLSETGPSQVIADDIELPFTHVDLSKTVAPLLESTLAELLQEQFHRPFNLSMGPLARFTLAGISQEEHVFIVCINHIVTDDWSLSLFFRELSTFYNVFCCGRSPMLAEQSFRCIDFAVAEQEFVKTREFETQLFYWKRQLADSSPTLNLPVKARPPIRTDSAASVSLLVAKDLEGRIHEICRQEKCTLFVFLLTVFKTLLARFTGDHDLSIGTIMSNRDRKILEQGFGFMTNTVVLRLNNLGTDASFHQVLQQVKEVLIEAHQNKDLPFDHLVREIPSVRSNAHAPLFQAIAFLQNTYEEHFVFNGIDAELIPANNPVTAFDLSLVLEQSARGLKIGLQYKTEVLEDSTAARLINDYEKILKWVLQRPDGKISAISLLTQQELQQLAQWNTTAVAYLPQEYSHKLFEQQVKITPEAVAVSCAGDSLSYRELNARANQLARYLQHFGVEPEKLVGICMERGVNAVLALLAVLKVGGAYVPLDPDYPVQRLQFMAEDAGFEVLLTHRKFAEALATPDLTKIHLDSDWQTIAAYDIHNLDIQLSPETPAYLIYTSGATGTPKGVVVPHRALANQLRWLKGEFPLSRPDRVLQRTTLSFDAATGEIFLPLLTGARLIIAEHGKSQDVDYLLRLMVQERITLADVPPSLLMVLLQHPVVQQCSGLRWVMCGGEVFSLELKERFSRTLNAQIYNLYGPTETTIQSTFHRCSAAETYGYVPIGQPIANTQVYVLDQGMELLPLGVAGMLYIGGVGLARGYLNRADLTAEHFVPDLFSGEPGARIFCTGDRVRWGADGKLEYLGRSDKQIKIRGYRIELGEIEAVLQTHPQVQQAVVVVVKDKPQQNALVAYVVANSEGPLDPDELRRHLKDKLPEYMVPWHFVFLEQIPLGPTGKIDRNALPAPERCDKQYRAPRTATEEILCGIFAEVLSIERAGIDDNFFALGGHSLMATQLVSHIRTALGIELPLRAVFESPTVAHLVMHLQSTGKARVPLVPQQRAACVPLSYAQQRLWFIDQMQGTSVEYNMPEALRLLGPLNLAALQSTIQTIVQRHESLRTHFVQIGSDPVQVIESDRELELPLEDLSQLDEGSKEGLIEAAFRREWEQPFDLMRGPLLRFRLLKAGELNHILLRTFHHIVSDGWSYGVFSREFMVLYEAYCEGRESPLKPLPVQYPDFTLWQRKWLNEERLVQHLDYWKQQLSGIPSQLALPLDRPRPPQQTFEARRLRIRLPQDRTAALKQLTRSSDATLYMTMIAAFAVLLQRYTGENDVVIGSPIANRQEAALELLIGFFVNSIVIRTRVDPESTLRDLLAKVRVTTLEAYSHQDLPFERLVAELSPERSLNTTPIYQVVFALQNAPLQIQRLKGLVTESVRSDELYVRFDMELHVLDQEGELELWWIYNRDLFDHWRIAQMAGHYIRLLEALTEHANEPVGSIAILSAEERRTVLGSFNATSCPVSQLTVVDMFVSQAAQTPNAPAVVCGKQRLSYQELDRYADMLSNQLLERGVSAESRIGLCVERSIEMVAGILGILKSGAAYVPLDPEYPLERLRYIVNDSGVKLIVSSRSQFPLVELTGADALLVNSDDSPAQRVAASDRIPNLLQLAYVIYTSGSTGKPKGVGVSHGNLLQTTQARWHTYERRPVNYLLLPSFAFDSSVAGLFWTLSQGGALHIPAKGMHNDVQALAQLIEQNEITHLLCLPTFYDQLLEEGGVYKLRSLQAAIVAGESCKPELAEKHFAFLSVSRLYNEYGPTEATVWSTVHRFELGVRLDRVPIGKPIANVQMYVLDAQMEPLPLGVAGELYIGGAGVARGYLNQPELTAERFLPNPFNTELGARLYRTGDIGRWRPDGELEFLGRVDQQVKIRGYRIEPEEIETVLRSHERVQDAVVMVREGAGQFQLLGYAVLRSDEMETERQQTLQIERWRQLYESIYQQPAESGDFNIIGWTDSYSGLPIPEDEMRIWVEETATRLCGLYADDVLEIGCGTGLLLTRIAHQTKSYTGIDFSAEALGQLGTYLARRDDMGHVVLRPGSADDLSFISDDSVDLVVLNSVIQYFPTVDYLLQVLSEACRVTRNGGHIFVGDIRSLPLASAYYTSVHLHKAAPEMLLEDLRQNIALARQFENELLIDPVLFTELGARWQKLAYAEATLKPGAYDNELNRFRFDVMLSVGPKKDLVPPNYWIPWEASRNWQRAVRQWLQDEPGRPVGLSGIPDKRVAAAVEAFRLLENESAPLTTAGQLRIAVQHATGEDPTIVIDFAQQLGVALSWHGLGADGLYRAVFNPQWREAGAYDDVAPSYFRRFANCPVQTSANAELSGALLDYLRQRLPEYMVPSAITVLPSWPLTVTGKIDRTALPSPDRRRQEYFAPETSLEASLADIWAEALHISRVGRDDNFFDLGGHSLLIPRIRFMIREKLQRDVPIVDFFAFPTVHSLAESMEGKHKPATVSDSEQRALQQRAFLLRKMQPDGLELQKETAS